MIYWLTLIFFSTYLKNVIFAFYLHLVSVVLLKLYRSCTILFRLDSNLSAIFWQQIFDEFRPLKKNKGDRRRRSLVPHINTPLFFLMR